MEAKKVAVNLRLDPKNKIDKELIDFLETYSNKTEVVKEALKLYAAYNKKYDTTNIASISALVTVEQPHETSKIDNQDVNTNSIDSEMEQEEVVDVEDFANLMEQIN